MSRIASGGTGRPLAMSANCSHAARAQHAADLVEHGPLVGAQVDHAVGDHHVGPAVLDRQLLGEALAELDVVEAERSRRSSVTWRASRGSCRRRRRDPPAPTWPAAMKLSNPAPEPTSTTRSPGCEVAQRERVADPGEGLDRPVGQRVDDAGVVAEPGGEGPAGVEVEGWRRVGGDLPVLVAHLASRVDGGRGQASQLIGVPAIDCSLVWPSRVTVRHCRSTIRRCSAVRAFGAKRRLASALPTGRPAAAIRGSRPRGGGPATAASSRRTASSANTQYGPRQ